MTHAELRSLRLATGVVVRTPLLVPSFSSRGFGLVAGEPVRSEVSALLDYFSGELPEAFLVSAYDLRHGLLQAGDTLGDWLACPLSRPQVLFVDSGGYETQPASDTGELLQDLRVPLPWSEEMYGELLDRLPADVPNVAAVGFDRPGESYAQQICAAQDFLAGRSHLAAVVLLKAPNRVSHDFRELEPVARRLAAFSVVGVTEHELGGSLLDRIGAVTALRDVLSRASLQTPIHVFGALDPIFVPLYFAAGADIFDGLTWLRYAYSQGLAVHREQGPLLDGLLEARDDVRRRSVLTRNLGALGQLQTKLNRFVAEDGDWRIYPEGPTSPIGPDGAILRDAYLSAMARRRP